LNVDLGLDIQKLVNNQNPTFAEREIPAGGLNVPSGIPGRLSTFKPLLIAAGALIVIMAAFAGVRAFNRPAPEQMADVASQADAPSAAIATNLPPLVQAASDPIVALANAGSASVANASGVSGVLAASDVAPASGAKAKGKSTVRLQFIAETWYQIKDDNGEMLVKGVAKAGTSITSLPGKPPLKVLVGNAMAVSSVELNGVAVSLGERQRNENLRLTLSE
jgi:cytoskeleton protein RodZ